MKKAIALLAAVMILAGSVGMTVSAATTACVHSSTRRVDGGESIETYTHSWQVGTSASGKPILAACLVEIGWHHYKIVCNNCHAVVTTYKEKVYEVHSLH